MKTLLTYLAGVAIVVGFVNFFWFIAESQSMGGDALNGYRTDDHCFVGSHGSFTQVGCPQWEQSRIHAISVFITHPLALISMGYFLFTVGFPAFIGGTTGIEAQRKADDVRGSGPALASARFGGRLGSVNFSGPMLGVSVYPGGLIVSPIFMTPIPIQKPEIRSLEVKRLLFGRQAIQLSHSSGSVASPLLLYSPTDSEVARAIDRITRMSFTINAPANIVPEPAKPDVSVVGTAESPPVMRLLYLFGLLVNFALVGYGVIWAIPTLGFGGVVWTTILLGIAMFNTYRFVIRRH